MRLSRRTIVIGSASAAAAVIIAVVTVLPDQPPRTTGAPRHPSGSLAQYQHATGPAGPRCSPASSSGSRLVLAVKIDNVVQARPPTGLTKADIVYLIPVEGGLSRIFAVFSSHFPPVIGPVRSTREDDLELLRQFGTPAFAFSGAQPQLLPVVERARIVDLYDGRARAERFPRPEPAGAAQPVRQDQAAAGRGAAPPARPADIGFRFGPAPAGRQGHSRPIRSAIRRPRSASTGRRGGRPGWSGWMARLRPPPKTASSGRPPSLSSTPGWAPRDSSREGVRPPYAYTVGSGRAVVPGRAFLPGPLVAAAGRWWHHIHHGIRPADDLRPGPDLGRPGHGPGSTR